MQNPPFIHSLARNIIASGFMKWRCKILGKISTYTWTYTWTRAKL